MTESQTGSPWESMATVPDHCEVTEIAAKPCSGTAPRSRRRLMPATIPAHQSSGRCSAPP